MFTQLRVQTALEGLAHTSKNTNSFRGEDKPLGEQVVRTGDPVKKETEWVEDNT